MIIGIKSQICHGKNRVFLPIQYKNSVFAGADTASVRSNMFSNGVYIWDTNGHDIGFISIGTESGERQCPQAAYLLTLVTQDGHRHTVRLLKQSEVFGN